MSLQKITLSEISAMTQIEPKPTPNKAFNALIDFPVRYRGISLRDCTENDGNSEAIKAASKWADGSVDNLFFYGPQGTGKTHIACAAMAQRSGRPEFVNVPTMLLKFQAAVKEHDELELINEYVGYTGRFRQENYQQPLRLFDDVAAHRVSDFSVEMFGIILDKMYSNCISGMIFTSNLSPKQILETMGERIASRLQGLANPVRVHGSDWRMQR